MKRPLLIRCLPDRFKHLAWHRFYASPAARWKPLYYHAPLRYAPGLAMQLIPGDIISDAIALTGIWRYHFSRRLLQVARQGGLLVDVGANLGYFSLIWAAAHPTNRCLAVEPAPRNLAQLRQNVATNGLAGRVRVEACAAGRADGTVVFDPGPVDQTGWGGVSTEAAPRTITVPVMTLDRLAGADTEIALLKIDTQGSDTWALRGAATLLQRRRIGEVWYEQNRPRMQALGVDPSEAAEFLKSVGYNPRPQNNPAADVVEWRAVPAN